MTQTATKYDHAVTLKTILRYTYTPARLPRPGTLSSMDHDGAAFSDPGDPEEIEFELLIEGLDVDIDLPAGVETRIEDFIRKDWQERQQPPEEGED